MTTPLLIEQSLNGLQLGVELFLMAAGLTLVFGIMNMINLRMARCTWSARFSPPRRWRATGNFLLGAAARGAGRRVASARCSRRPCCGGSTIAATSTRCWSPSA